MSQPPHVVLSVFTIKRLGNGLPTPRERSIKSAYLNLKVIVSSSLVAAPLYSHTASFQEEAPRVKPERLLSEIFRGHFLVFCTLDEGNKSTMLIKEL